MENPGNQTPTTGADPKVVAIVSYITIIGWIVALVLNNPKSDLGSFHIRQALGIFLLGIVLSIIPFINFIAWVIPLVLWILGLISAIQGEKKPVPVVGELFQKWFNSL